MATIVVRRSESVFDGTVAVAAAVVCRFSATAAVACGGISCSGDAEAEAFRAAAPNASRNGTACVGA